MTKLFQNLGKFKNKVALINDDGTQYSYDQILEKTKYINSFIKKRRVIAQKYFDGLKELDIQMPIINKKNFHVFHIFAVCHSKRELILRKMKSKNINLSIHYPHPIHTMKAYKKYTCDNCNCLTETEKKAKMVFSLPIYPSIKNYEIENVIKNIKKII